jgi:hypothetical protein
MPTLYRAGYSLAGITTVYFTPNRRHKKAAQHAHTLQGWILTRRYNNTPNRRPKKAAQHAHTLQGWILARRYNNTTNKRHKKQPSMLTLYRAGYSLAGSTIHLIINFKK